MLKVYVVGKKVENYGKCVCRSSKTIKIMLNVSVVGKGLSKSC